jgi:DNA-binding transcriptional LysR family regulator
MRHAQALFATERKAEEEMRSLRGLEEGSLRIGASTTIASYMIAEYLAFFTAPIPTSIFTSSAPIPAKSPT